MSRPFTPRPYQILIRDCILVFKRFNIWLFMGAGKTASVISALVMLSFTEKDIFPALILAPLRVANNVWPAEVKKWSDFSHLRIQRITGTEAERKLALRTKADIFCINYENMEWLIAELGPQVWPFKTVVADEATKLKGFRLKQGTVRAKALSMVTWTHVLRFYNLTGTPSPNGLKDLWGQNWFIDKGQRLGITYDGFKQRWFQRSFDGYSIDPLPFAQEQIQKKLEDVCISLDPKDYFDINDPIIINVTVDLPKAARELYRQMEHDMFIEIGEHPIEAFNAAARTNKCAQLANGAAYIEHLDPESTKPKDWRVVHDVKLEALEDIIEEAAGAPVMVAYEFKSDLARLKKHFPKARVLDKDPKTEDEWNAGKIPILLVHPASAGHGLNLQYGGNILIFFGHSWNLEQFLQIVERIGPVRQIQAGFNRNVFLYFIIARNTVDEDFMTRRETKKQVQDILLESMKKRMSI